ncbi:hypothetical protein PHYSODRAFT_339729 [Phytophthora sojae]|uniref:Uncharacterized protein n=1 Tax=Phytophthora sojae (strain P6497) TaxID=1094619 RepID=G5A7F0_PHYSP|nr:hypothetical protein PHYSODRAFT_339729 [Phytophthora sojae]EGZ07829.1 hypothetical protein PHYSODRAFT_339729 [Phytophthora sojae]|eukprot:XP_009536001.1 hypothetical protein PHYSODRAFT_339729 [Phytophthora sojae]
MSSSGAPAAPPASVASSLQSSHPPARDEGEFAELVDSASRARGVSDGQEHPVIDLTTSRGFDRESESASRTSPRRSPSPRGDTTSDAADLGRSDSARPVSLDSLAALIHAQSDLEERLKTVEEERDRWKAESKKSSPLLTSFRKVMAESEASLKSASKFQDDKVKSALAHAKDLGRQLRERNSEIERLTQLLSARDAEYAVLQGISTKHFEQLQESARLLISGDAQPLRDAKATIKHQREVILRQNRVISRMGLLPMHDPHMALW